MTTVDDYIKSCKHILRQVNHLEADFEEVDYLLAEEWADQIEWLIHNSLNFLLKCTTKRQALQITAISKRFNKHRVMFERLGVIFP